MALLFASANAINMKQTNQVAGDPISNTCVNVRKDTMVEEACNTDGNSAWDPTIIVEDPADLGWKKGFKAMYWFSDKPCKATGCPMEGDPGFVGTTDTINFTNNGEF